MADNQRRFEDGPDGDYEQRVGTLDQAVRLAYERKDPMVAVEALKAEATANRHATNNLAQRYNGLTGNLFGMRSLDPADTGKIGKIELQIEAVHKEIKGLRGLLKVIGGALLTVVTTVSGVVIATAIIHTFTH